MGDNSIKNNTPKMPLKKDNDLPDIKSRKKPEWLEFFKRRTVTKKRLTQLAALGIVLSLGSLGTAVALHLISKNPTVSSNNNTYVTRNGDTITDSSTNNSIVENVDRLSKTNLDNTYAKKESADKTLKDIDNERSTTEKSVSENKDAIQNLRDIFTRQVANRNTNQDEIETNAKQVTNVDEKQTVNEENIQKLNDLLAKGTEDIKSIGNSLDSLMKTIEEDKEKLAKGNSDINGLNAEQTVINENVSKNKKERTDNEVKVNKNFGSIEDLKKNLEDNYVKKTDVQTDFYNKEKADEELQKKIIDKNNFYTKSEINEIIKTGLYTKSEYDALKPDLTSLLTKVDAMGQYLNKQGGKVAGSVLTTRGIKEFQDSEFVSKGYVDDENAQYLIRDGRNTDNILSGSVLTTRKISEFEDKELVSKEYVDFQIGTIDVQNNIKKDGEVSFTKPVEGVTPTEDQHLATKGYVDVLAGGFDLSNFLKKSGGSISGAISLGYTSDGMGKMVPVTPTDDNDLVNAGYIGDQINTKYTLATIDDGLLRGLTWTFNPDQTSTIDLKVQDDAYLNVEKTSGVDGLGAKLEDGVFLIPKGYTTKLIVTSTINSPNIDNINVETQLIGVYQDPNNANNDLEEVVSTSLSSLDSVNTNPIKNSFSTEFIRSERINSLNQKYKGFYLRFIASGYKSTDEPFLRPGISDVKIEIFQKRTN